MAQTQLADVIVPAEFTAYQVENSLVSTALFTSGVQSKLKIIERFNRPAIPLVLANILQHRVETLRRPLCEFIQARDPLRASAKRLLDDSVVFKDSLSEVVRDLGLT